MKSCIRNTFNATHFFVNAWVAIVREPCYII